jgi:farnesyl-diphosphate farnesyltransferase
MGLSRLFHASGLESREVGQDLDRANSMGLFLQKTNIIRDYREDLEEGRTWWPRHVGWLAFAAPALPGPLSHETPSSPTAGAA